MEACHWECFDVAVVGGGPAGLRAAEVAATQGAKVALFDAKPSVGRKFLVAGRGGLNLTHSEEMDDFEQRYRSGRDVAAAQGEESRLRWKNLLEAFGPSHLREWASGLGVETFSASTGRVYPIEMKAAPLLRRWVARLRSMGVEFRMRHRLRNWDGENPVRLIFERENGEEKPPLSDKQDDGSLKCDVSRDAGEQIIIAASAVVLALGGASWPQTGSDGTWVGLLKKKGVCVAPLRPANCGWEREWSPEVLAACEGQPLKNVCVSAAGVSVRGELMVTRYGLEGGALYALSGALSELQTPALRIDFKPDSTVESLVRRLGTARSNLLAEARRRWRLEESAAVLLAGLLPDESYSSQQTLARSVKECDLTLLRPRSVDESISTAGGVDFLDLDGNLMLKSQPGVFVAGEMLDWEAPTGGYLMQGCYATGTRAGGEAFKRAMISK
jgi:uncharacterized flavoprotein (TIGR03862 family)